MSSVRSRVYPREFFRISEAMFWGDLTVPKGVPGAEALSEAIRLGKAGRKKAAYAALNDYHRGLLAREWAVFQDQARSAAPLERTEVRKLLRRDLLVPPNYHYTFGDHIDFASGDQGANGRLWLQGSGWLQPLVMYATLHPDPGILAFLRETVLDFYASRTRVPPAEHYCFGALGYDRATQVYVHAYCLLLAQDEPVPTAVTEAVMKFLLGAGRKVWTFVEGFVLHNIHTAGCVSVFRVACLFPEFSESAAWRETGGAHLLRHTGESYLADGGHLERCWGYAWHTLNRLIRTLRFAGRYGGLGALETPYLANVHKALQWFAKSVGPGLLAPGYGDDGVAPVHEVLDAARDLFPGDKGFAGVDRTVSYLLEPSGFAIMRNGDEKESVYANLSFGEYAGWHSHFDCLNLNVRRGTSLLLEEVGRIRVSYDHGLDRTFRMPEAHNQVTVDGYPYDSRRLDRCEEVHWYSDERIDYFSAAHRAYRQVPAPADAVHRTYVGSDDLVVRRSVVFVKDPGYFVILDAVLSETTQAFNRAISAWWHSSNPFKVLGPTTARTAGRTACLLQWAYEEELHRLEPGWDFDRTVEWVGDDRYSLRARRWQGQSHLGISGFLTVIVPFSGRLPVITVRPLKSGGAPRYRAEALAVTTARGRDTFVLNPERLSGFVVSGRKAPHRALVTLGRGRGRVAVR